MKTRAAPKTGASHPLRGVLVVDDNGKELASSGIAAHGETGTRILVGWHKVRHSQRSLFSVEATDGTPVVVVAFPTPRATVLVAMQRDGRDPLFELIGSVDFAGDILTHFLTNPFEALTVVDRVGILRFVSPVHERFFGVAPGSAVGRHVTEVIENTRLHHVAETGRPEIGSLQESVA
jgi:transcriptional regulator with PAS, ATPase and Fis domain